MILWFHQWDIFGGWECIFENVRHWSYQVLNESAEMNHPRNCFAATKDADFVASSISLAAL